MKNTEYHIQVDLEGLAPEDAELLRSLAEKLRRAGPERWLIRDISKRLVEYEERRLRLVYFFSKNLT